MPDLLTLSRESIDTIASVAALRRRLASVEGKLANALRKEDQSGPRLVRIARTTTNDEFPDYPEPCADTFVVELGSPSFDPTPGDQAMAFSEYDSAVSPENRETRVAHDPTGKYWTEGSIVWVQLHHGQWFIVSPPVELLRVLLTGPLARCGSATARVLISAGDGWCDTFCDITVVDALGVVCYECGAQDSRVAGIGTAAWVKWMDDSGKYEVVAIGEACCDTSSSASGSVSSSSSRDGSSTSVSESSSSSSSSSSSGSSGSSSSSQSESTSTSEPPFPSSSSQSESVSEPSVSTSENCLEVVTNVTWDPVTCEMTVTKKTICGDFTIRD